MSTQDDLLELLAEWRKTCSLAGMAYTDADAAAFVAEAYPFNRLDDLAAAESRVADLEAGIRKSLKAAHGLAVESNWGGLSETDWTEYMDTLRALVGDNTTRNEATP